MEIAELVARGDAFLRTGDVASARLFYERAADAGDGRAALRVGATFDPAFLDRPALHAARGDPAEARVWYHRARDLGEAEAERRLKSVGTKQGGELP
jgi:TPR repeat protein